VTALDCSTPMLTSCGGLGKCQRNPQEVIQQLQKEHAFAMSDCEQGTTIGEGEYLRVTASFPAGMPLHGLLRPACNSSDCRTAGLPWP
jgi:hypothetical protein